MRASKKFNNKCSENSRSQIVFRTDIFQKLSLGALDNNVECSTGVIFLDPCPNKLINCESINADLDLIYHQIYSRECVFSFSKERQNLRLDECLKEKWRRSKVSYIQKEIFRQTQFPIWGCLSVGQTTDGVQHRDLLSHFQFC